MKEWYVYYHEKGQRVTAFNQNRMYVEARDSKSARSKARSELGSRFTIESVRRAH